MVRSWLFNLLFASFGFVIVFSSALSKNSLLTATICGIITFVSFFLIGYLFRWMIQFIISNPNKDNNSKINNSEHISENSSASQEGDNGFSKTLSSEEAKRTSEYIKNLINEKD